MKNDRADKIIIHRTAGAVNDHWDIILRGIGSDLAAVSGLKTLLNPVDDLTIAPIELDTNIQDSAKRIVRVEGGAWLQNTANRGEHYVGRIRVTSGVTINYWPEDSKDWFSLIIE